jgi:predicted nucleic acid-binding protein
VTRVRWPDRYVVDASVALAFAWSETHSDAAGRLFDAVKKRGTQLIAPEFWLVECANGCWKRVQRRWKTPEEVIEAMRLIESLPVVRMDSAGLQDATLAIAIQTRTSCYDALYVATAQFADVPLVTGDARLVQMLKDAAWEGDVFHISEW